MQQRGPEWDPATWEELRTAMREVVERNSIVRQALPQVIVPDSTTTVNAETWTGDGTVDATATLPLLEIYADFKLRAEQVERESSYHEGRGAVQRIARELVDAADRVLLNGASGDDGDLPARVKQRPARAAFAGLLPGGASASWPKEDRRWGELFIRTARAGLAALRSKAQYGPYVLISPPAVDAGLRSPIDKSTVTPLENLDSDVERALAARQLEADPDDGTSAALLLSTGGNSMDLVLTEEDFTLTFVRVDEDGMHVFRVAHRFALRIKDKDAAVRIDVQAPA